jgi:hypothetical protein
MATDETIDRIIQESVIGAHLHDGKRVPRSEEMLKHLVERIPW